VKRIGIKYLDDVFVGAGLKKMKGYISPISLEELEKKRAEYWGINLYFN
jgi:hypothetical protein